MKQESEKAKAVRGVLSGERTVSFRSSLKRITGSYCAALMLAQLMYWHPRAADEWIYKTDADMSEEICASNDELQAARAKLAKLGFVETKRIGLPARMHYRVDFEKIANALLPEEKAEPEQEQTPPVSENSRNLLPEVPETSIGLHSDTSFGNSPKHTYTEMTTEMTTSEGADAHAFAPSGIRSEATTPRAARDPLAIQADFDALAAAGRARGADRTAAAHPLAGRWPHLVDLCRAFEDTNGTRLADLPKSQVTKWAKDLEGHYQAALTPDDERELVRMAKTKRWDLYSPGSADKLIGHLRRHSPTLTEPTYAKPSF